MDGSRGTTMRRAALLLRALAASEDPRGLRVGELARITAVEKSQVSRTLRVLLDEALVDRDPVTSRYTIGVGIHGLAVRSERSRLLRATPWVLRGLVAATGGIAQLRVREGRDVVTVAAVAHPAVSTAEIVGARQPLDATPVGLALLLDHRQVDLARLFAGPALPTDEPRDPASVCSSVSRLSDRLDEVRAAGSVVVDTSSEDVVFAAPVRGLGGRIIAAIELAGHAGRFERGAERVGAVVALAAQAAARTLGAPQGQEASSAGGQRRDAVPFTTGELPRPLASVRAS